jgi:LacI family transcriptional regulator
VGFDDNVYSQIIRPALTTVHQDVTEKGSLAVDKLLQMIGHQEIGERVIRLPVHIVERSSVKRIKGTHE